MENKNNITYNQHLKYSRTCKILYYANALSKI